MFAKTASDRVLSELENLFRTLALESKKTHSHLKHATEKAIMKLREYRNLHKSMNELKYVLSNDVILRPLILSWSSKHISISLTALNILQKLLNVNCISSDSFMQILISLRTLLTLQTNYKSSSQHQWNNLDINIQIKMCQILIQIPASPSWSVSRPFLQHIVYITLLLCQSEEAAVRSTSLAALQQIATVALEYSVNTDRYGDPNKSIEDESHSPPSDTEPMYIFECLFHDLCCLASPKLLYLNKSMMNTPHPIPSEKDKENDKTSNTAVAFSNIELQPPNHELKDEISDDIDIIASNVYNSQHIAHVSELERDNNLSTLRLLDCDFEIDYVPILQLLETLIANKEYFGCALKMSNGLLHILREQLCPLMCEMIRDHTLSSFEGMIRIARLIIELLSRHYVYLEIETDLILSALLRLLELNNDFPHWAPIIILEILRHLLKNSFLLKFFYIKYDMNSNSDKRVFGSLIHGLGRFLHQTTSNKPKYTSKWSPKRLDRKYFSFIKDIRNTSNDYDPSLQVTLAVLALISFTEGLAVVCNVSSSVSSSSNSSSFIHHVVDTPPPLQSTTYPPRNNNEQEIEDVMSSEHDITLDVSRDIARHMVEVVWRPLLAALSHMLTQSVEEAQYQQLLSIYQTTARICGRIQLTKPLERLLSSMSEHALPHPFFNYTFSDILYNLSSNKDMFAANTISDSNIIGASSTAASSSSVSSSSSSSDALHDDHNDINEMGSVSPSIHGNISFVQQTDAINNNEALHVIKLSIKNVCTIHALVNIAHGLGSILDSAWSVLLETFEKLDYIFHRQNIQLVDIFDNVISPDSHWNDEVNMLDSRLQQLFDSSEYLDDNSLCELLAALGHLSSSSLAGLATTLDKVPDASASSQRLKPSSHGQRSKNILSNDDAISVDKVKSFALRKFVQTIEVNIHRLNKIWDHVIAHLHVIMNFKNSTLRHFGIKTLIRIQLKVLNETPTNSEDKDKDADEDKTRDEFQKRLFSPYLKLFRSKYADTRERVIRAVSELLENAGDKITCGWPAIVELLNYVPSTENNHSVTVTCLKLAFDDVRLISSDFMECLPDFCILGLIKTVGLFGKQRLDNNISYSSIGLLWKISDHITLICTKRDDGNNEDARQERLIVIADGLQIAIFKQLQVLCVDGRSDVRNCAMQTINSALVAYGDRLELSKWMECIKILVVLLTDVVVKRTRLNQQQDAAKRSQLTRREYRAFKKKWNETEKHCIRGGSRICKMFIAKLHKEAEFRSYWTYYLETIIKLLDLNVEVASTGIQCLQDIAQSTDFIYCCSQEPRYWTEIINCYESMIRNVGHKEYEIITARHRAMMTTETEAEDATAAPPQPPPAAEDVLTLPFADVCDAMMESIRDLLNPEMASRKLFNLTQIEKLISNLDFLISDKNLGSTTGGGSSSKSNYYNNGVKYQSLEILDARLVRLKKLLAIYEQLPPLAPSIARPIISKIASYLTYVSKCCHCYHHYALRIKADEEEKEKEKREKDVTPNTVSKLARLSLSEKSLLRKTEKTMDFVSQKAITLLSQFYSIHIPSELKVECFEIVLNGISTIMNPFLCPIAVVTNAITGFEDVCKTGLPQFSAHAHATHSNGNNNDENNSNNNNNYKLSSVESLRVWSVLGDVVSIAFRLQHENTGIRHHHKKSKKQQNYKSTQEMNKKLQKLVELKLSILETTMQHILPFGHFAPQSLKKRIVMLLNSYCSSEGDTHANAYDDNNSINSINIQRHSRLSEACISAMFELCGQQEATETNEKYDCSLSAMSYQLLIPKIAFILDQYIDDELSKPSNRPLPIYRQKHIVHILNHIKNLKINPKLDSVQSYFHNNNENNNKTSSSSSSSSSSSTTNSLYYSHKLEISGIKTNQRPHLFRLYPVLCKLIRVEDHQIKNSLCQVFKVFGQEMGLN